MAYWWLLERKSFKDEPIKLTPAIGEKVQQAWINGQAKIYLPHLKFAIDNSDIKAIGVTTERMPEQNAYALGNGIENIELKPYGHGRPLYGMEFEQDGIKYQAPVLCNWYKKNVDRREWDDYYAQSPGYYRIDENDGSVWVAMLLAEEANTNKPEYLVRCSAIEAKHLEGKRSG